MPVVEVEMDGNERAELTALMEAEQPTRETLPLMFVAALCTIAIQRFSGVGFELPKSPLQAVSLLALIAGSAATFSLLLLFVRSLTQAPGSGISTRRKLLHDALEDQHVVEASGEVNRLVDIRSPRASGGTLLIFLDGDTCLVLPTTCMTDQHDPLNVDESSTQSRVTLRMSRRGSRILSLTWHGPRPEREMRLITRPRHLLDPPRILRKTTLSDLESLVKRV